MHIQPNIVWSVLAFLTILCSNKINCDNNTVSLDNDLIVNVGKMLEKEFITDNLQVAEVVDKFLKKKSWRFKIANNVEVQVREINNSCWDFKLNTTDVAIGRGMKMSMKSMKRMLPYLILPGLVMAGVLPWVLPGLKMLVGTVSMVNQLAFNAALFALIRSYIFDTESEEHVLYINHGYRKKNNQHSMR